MFCSIYLPEEVVSQYNSDESVIEPEQIVAQAPIFPGWYYPIASYETVDGAAKQMQTTVEYFTSSYWTKPTNNP